jgi:hypothetical protein
MQFRWIEWNEEHIAKHGVQLEEAELIIRHAQAPFPQQIGEDNLLAWRQTPTSDLRARSG